MSPDNAGNTAGASSFGKYTIVRELGSGGFGVVYEARLPGPMGFAKRVAIKRLRTHVTDLDSAQLRALINEARIGGLLHHPNIVDVVEFGQHDGAFYMAMEFVDGPTFTDLVELRSRGIVELPPFATLDLAIQVCRGLQYAHEFSDEQGSPLNLIHRDLKPSNFIVDRQGVAKVLDFGIAKAASNRYLTSVQQGVVKGTPRYMSPEQIRGEAQLTPTSDVFSLAATLWELVVGDQLVKATSLADLIEVLMLARFDEEIERAEVALPGMGPILGSALRSDPMERTPDARTLASELRRLGHGHPPEADIADVIADVMPAVEALHTDRRVHEVGQRVATGERTPEDEGALFDRDVGDGRSPSATPQIGPVSGDAPTAPLAPSPPPAPGATPRSSPETSPSTGRLLRNIAFAATVPALVAMLLGVYVLPRLGQRSVEEQSAGPEVLVGVSVEQATPVVPAKITPEPVAEHAAVAELPTDEPASAAQELTPAPVEEHIAAAEAVTTAPVAAEPGTISVRSSPWSAIYVDGTLVKSDVLLKQHEVGPGAHEVRLVCSTVENREKVFSVSVDGDDVSLGCWDFRTMAACQY